MTSRSRFTRRRDAGLVAGVALGAAAIGLSVFGALAWRAVSIRHASQSEALTQFDAVRARFSPVDPLVQRDRSGRFARHNPSRPSARPPTQLRVLAYRAAEERLASADVPLWFLRVKGPAAALARRGTGFDLESLGLTAEDLTRAGVGVVLDETRDDGDRVLAWTE
jgi:hypothetical protein